MQYKGFQSARLPKCALLAGGSASHVIHFHGPTQHSIPNCFSIGSAVFGRPFLKRFALCYQTVVCLSCPVCNVGVLCPNGWMDEDKTWLAGRPRPWPHCVRWGPRSPSPKVHSPQFSSHICCAQMARWIKMTLGRKVGLDPSDIVLDGDPAPPPPKTRQSPSIFGPCLLWPNGWMDQDATWYDGRPRPRPHCVRWGPSSPLPERGTAPQF